MDDLTRSLNTFITNDDTIKSLPSSYDIFETQYKCTLNPNEYNYNTNPTLISGSQGEVYDFVNNSYFSPYITTAGLYDDNYNLLAVANQPNHYPHPKLQIPQS